MNHLSQHGYPYFKNLDVDEPESGGLKLSSLKDKVADVIEELAMIKKELGNGMVTGDKPKEEEEKLPESAKKLEKSD